MRSSARVGLAALLSLASPAAAEEPARAAGRALQDAAEARSASAEPQALSPRAIAALEKGLGYLASRQAENPDGSFPQKGAQFNVPVPIGALAALAFMSAGSTPERGPHGKGVVRALDYLLSRAEMTPGSQRFGYLASDGDRLSRMHGHGFATLALAQAYCMSPKTPRGERTAEVLRAAVALIEKSQGIDGGWYYEPQGTIEHENSVTVCLIQALRGAHNAGIAVDSKVIARAVDYVRRCQNPDGSFRYGLDIDNNTVALTAAGMATLNATGQYSGPELERGMQNLWKKLSLREEHGLPADARYPHYERLYVAQALWHSEDARSFDRWFALESETLLTEQAADGSWSDDQFGPCYATAMHCLVLALPLGMLPIFQR